MSHLLRVMVPFRNNMNSFIDVYNKVNTILDIIQSPGFGYEVTQADYFIAAEEARYSPLDAEDLLKLDFVNICRILTAHADSNEEGSIENMVRIMDDESRFVFRTDDVDLENEYAELQYKFERSIVRLNRDLRIFLQNVDSGVEAGIFNAPADVDPNTVLEAISNYTNFINFLEVQALNENLENVARGYRNHNPVKKTKKSRKSNKSRKSRKSNRSKKSRKSNKFRKSRKPNRKRK